MKNKKSFLFITCILCLVAMIVAAMPAPADEFKNLQVLPKNISKHDLDSLMHSYNEGLGVKCGYCHVKKEGGAKGYDFEKDGKSEKIVARQMITMTASINEKYFHGIKGSPIQAVSCYTCHHGNPMPAIDSADFSRKRY